MPARAIRDAARHRARPVAAHPIAARHPDGTTMAIVEAEDSSTATIESNSARANA
jgi:hypothetical protein